MRTITKGAEPPSLTAHRQTPHCDYGNYADKAALRHALVTEQRGICCYCMARIRNGTATMKIEHWRSQSRHEGEQLNYRNLLGACLGGDGLPPHLQHCDTLKGDQDLRWNPAEPAHRIETRLSYKVDGSIRSDDHDFDREIEHVLNLNLPIIKNNRRGVLDALLAWWATHARRLPQERRQLQRELDRRVAGTSALQPYCQVAVWWIEQRLRRMTA